MAHPTHHRADRRPPRHGRPAGAGGGHAEALYGINPVHAALSAGARRLEQLLVREGRLSGRLAELRELALERRLKVSELPPFELERTCGSPDHQGAVLRCGALPVRQEGELPAAQPRTVVLALDEVQDPRNFGAILRCCAVFGIAGVVLPRHHGAPLSPAASKASAGFLESFPVFVVANLARCLANRRKAGFWVAGAMPEGVTPLAQLDRELPLLLVMGNEGKGLRPLVAQQCDFTVSIPAAGTGSLNVSAATAVFLYHLTQQA